MDVELMKKLVYEDRKSYYPNISQNRKHEKEERIYKSSQMMITFKRPQLHQMNGYRSSYINTDSPIVDSLERMINNDILNENNEKSSESHDVITFKKLPKNIKMNQSSIETLQLNERQENGDKS